MPISMKLSANPECNFAEWSINKEKRAKLVEVVAYLYLRQEENAQRVINALEPRRRASKGQVAQNVVRKLTAPHVDDVNLLGSGTEAEKNAARKRIKTSIIHRDGLLFQHISWVAARMALPNGYMTAPHVRQADKDFDGFIVELDGSGREIKRIVLCEDKASKSPRDLIRWTVRMDGTVYCHKPLSQMLRHLRDESPEKSCNDFSKIAFAKYPCGKGSLLRRVLRRPAGGLVGIKRITCYHIDIA